MAYKLRKAKKTTFFKDFGKNPTKRVYATTFDGKNKVIVKYPISPKKAIRKEVSDFLLNELDDDKALNQFMKREKISQRELESYW